MKTRIVCSLIGLGIMFMYNCTSVKPVLTSKKDHRQKFIPPGTAQVSDSLYMDKTEITNISWREYMYWLGRVHGLKSEIYKAAVPDTNCWQQFNNKLWVNSIYYLKGPNYSNHPVIGITHKQAKDFCKWRTNVVFEWLLINGQVIPMNPDQLADDHFSIDRYFNGEYMNTQPDSNFLYYPKYHLPNLQEIEQARKYNSTLNKKRKHDTLSHQEILKKHELVLEYMDTSKNVQNRNLTWEDVQKSTFSPTQSYQDKNRKQPYVLGLSNNVQEFSLSKIKFIPGSWIDAFELDKRQKLIKMYTPNAWTGFRCSCSWEKHTEE